MLYTFMCQQYSLLCLFKKDRETSTRVFILNSESHFSSTQVHCKQDIARSSFTLYISWFETAHLLKSSTFSKSDNFKRDLNF